MQVTTAPVERYAYMKSSQYVWLSYFVEWIKIVQYRIGISDITPRLTGFARNI